MTELHIDHIESQLGTVTNERNMHLVPRPILCGCKNG